MRKTTTTLMALAAVLLATAGCNQQTSASKEPPKAETPAGESAAAQPTGVPENPTMPKAGTMPVAPPLPEGVTELPAGHPPIGGMMAAAGAGAEAPAAGAVSGSVLETMEAGGYTYLQVKTDKGDVWMAGPATKLAKGDKVTASGAMMMHNFHSKTLNRTFPEILFVGGLEVAKP